MKKAGEARRKRAELKELLSMGSLDLAELFRKADEDDIVAGTKVSAVLAALPGLGKVKAQRMMEEHGIAENRRIRGLGDRQRKALLDAVS